MIIYIKYDWNVIECGTLYSNSLDTKTWCSYKIPHFVHCLEATKISMKVENLKFKFCLCGGTSLQILS